MDTTRTSVFCTFTFEGFHKWATAPEPVAFLRDRHRHVFHVRAEVGVKHNDRDVEFILLKRAMESYVTSLCYANKIKQNVSTHVEGRTAPYHADLETWSCERWGEELLNAFQLDKVEISEDGENGAVVERIL